MTGSYVFGENYGYVDENSFYNIRSISTIRFKLYELISLDD